MGGAASGEVTVAGAVDEAAVTADVAVRVRVGQPVRLRESPQL